MYLTVEIASPMKKIVFALAMWCAGHTAFAQDISIVPQPVKMAKGKGVYKINAELQVYTDSTSHKAVVFLLDYLRKNGYAYSLVDTRTIDKKFVASNGISLITVGNKLPNPEAYNLSVTDKQVVIKGNGAGLFYGVQSLLQLIEPQTKGIATIPTIQIEDEPRFPYRGMHLDVCRHYFPVEFIKKYIDVMAMYKLNNFHWHLTDDQGWRIEIKKYPKLTEVGSKRAQTKIGGFTKANEDLYDNMPYEGFYTQDQVKEIVAYAADRYINVIPEIEMPGHSLAALAAYPIMSCDPSKKYKVAEIWGVFNDVYCPTDTTFKMLGEILDEVIALFPSKYIHIGGDECPKEAWKQSEFCQQIIRDSALRDEHGLQSYFIRRIERHVNAMGRKIIGWDEILEGGLAPNATVMSWRGEAGGIAAAQLNHDVIMTPGSGGLYFDHAQSTSLQEPLSIGGNAPLSKTYSYEPIPDVLSADQAKHVIGVQANLWTEYIATPEKAEYMLLPRMLALSEVAWSTKQNRDYEKFSNDRLPKQLFVLENKGYHFRVPESLGSNDSLVKAATYDIMLYPSVKNAKVHYTLDGYTPGFTDPILDKKLKIVIPAGKSVLLQTRTITDKGQQSSVSIIKINN